MAEATEEARREARRLAHAADNRAHRRRKRLGLVVPKHEVSLAPEWIAAHPPELIDALRNLFGHKCPRYGRGRKNLSCPHITAEEHDLIYDWMASAMKFPNPEGGAL